VSLIQLLSKGQLLTGQDTEVAGFIALNAAAMLAVQDEQLLMNRSEEAQLVKSQVRASESSGAAPNSAELVEILVTKRQRLHDSCGTDSDASLFDRDDLLNHVFSYVGGGDHLHTGGVSKSWRDRYIHYCVRTSVCSHDAKLVTDGRSVLMTKARLQQVLRSGLTVAGWTFDKMQKAALVCECSLEPEKVMALLRAHGVPWSTMLCNSAAFCNKLALLQWLHSHSCPWEADRVPRYASRHGSVAMLEWLWTVTAPWSYHVKLDMLVEAGCSNELAAVKWLRARNAVWPQSFSMLCTYSDRTVRKCWSAPAVEWALACCVGWLDWQCEDYSAKKYEDALYKQQATELLEWAHANGCPCTCGHVQQQQQQQQQQQ
jgi:hypothetical protein